MVPIMSNDHSELINGRYRLVEVIGQGGMGTVWRGYDEMLDREVAVKEILLPRELDAEQRSELSARAMREARSAARIDHPGIITVFDVAERDGCPVIVMEFIRGRSLADVIRDEGPLPYLRVAEIGAAMLDALRDAHAAGIVHRDLKPANVLLTDRRVVITDFGIASLAGDATITKSGVLMGSPAYMAPEQAHRHAATPASDLWSFGATLYTAVEGHPPYQGPDFVSVLSGLLTQEPIAPQRAGPLTPLLGALFQKDPARRATAEQASAMLAGVLGEAGVRPAALPQFPYGTPTVPPGVVVPTMREGTIPAGTLGAAVPLHSGGTTPRPAARTGRRFGLVALISVPVVALAVTGFVVWSPTNHTHSGTRSSGTPAAALAGAPSPDQTGDSGNNTTSAGGPAKILAVAISPDGKTLAEGDGDSAGTVRLWDLATRRKIVTLGGHYSAINALAFSPDGRTLALGTTDNENALELWDVATHKRVVAFTVADPQSLVFSPDGGTLTVGGWDHSVERVNMATKRLTTVMPGSKSYDDLAHAQALSPDGATLVTEDTASTVSLWDVASHRKTATLHGNSYPGNAVAYSPDGKTVAGSDGSNIRLWDTTSHQQTRDFPLVTSDPDVTNSIAFSADGRTLATGGGDDKTVRLWDLADQRQIASLRGHTGTVLAVAFSHDGKILATGSKDKTIRLWDMSTHRQIAIIADR
jgi:tRNA A-37 threonylcarbamoyl transferase component Bud32